jgi:uncharacterized protein with HEPN domain
VGHAGCGAADPRDREWPSGPGLPRRSTAPLAVERCLEILGEAARRISDRVRLEHPEIPWHQIIAQRNVLAHEYGDIRHEMIWRVVSERIPELLTILERLVPPPPPPEG